jgi:hypothetical protein
MKKISIGTQVRSILRMMNIQAENRLIAHGIMSEMSKENSRTIMFKIIIGTYKSPHRCIVAVRPALSTALLH